MSQLSTLLRDTEDNGLMFWCPGCNGAHRVAYGEGKGPRWSWNGDVDKPTFSPSVLLQWDQWVPPASDPQVVARIKSGEIVQTQVHHVCHSFITAGRIQFLDDCTHALKGRTVELPSWEDDE